MITKILFRLMVASLCLTIAACVTTTTSLNTVNEDAAHDKRIELGMKYLEIGKRDNARRQFSMALELDSKSAQAYHGIALVHIANGEIKPAEDAFKKALSNIGEQNRTEIEVSYGKYLMGLDRFEEACPYFEQATTDYDYEGRVDALYLAGQCAQRRGDFERMRGAYEHVVNLQPNYVPVLLDLADIYLKSEDYAKSKKMLDVYAKNAKHTARSLWLAIRIERIFGNRDKESSLALMLKSMYPYSKEFLEYKRLLEQK